MQTIKILFAILLANITIQSERAQSDKTERSVDIKTNPDCCSIK
ncbi:MAG: hypothetical protein V4556_12145 [Bacteroidota bacterium]